MDWPPLALTFCHVVGCHFGRIGRLGLTEQHIVDCLFHRNLTKTCRVQAMMKMQEDQRRIRIVELDEIQGSTSCGIFSTPEVFRVKVNAVDSYCLKALDSLSFRFSNVGTKGRAGGKELCCTTSVLSRIGQINQWINSNIVLVRAIVSPASPVTIGTWLHMMELNTTAYSSFSQKKSSHSCL